MQLASHFSLTTGVLKLHDLPWAESMQQSESANPAQVVANQLLCSF